MFPDGAFLGFADKSFRLPVATTAVLAVDVYGRHDHAGVWRGLVSNESVDRGGTILTECIAPVLTAARAAGVPIVYAANSAPRIALDRSAYAEMKHDTLCVDQNVLYSERGIDPLEYNAGDSQVLAYEDEIKPLPTDYYIRKHVHSAFFDTRLDTLLRNLRVQNLICLGFALDVCLGTTMMDAVWRNYRVLLLRDCTYAIELPEIDSDGSWTRRWITYVECCIGYTTTSADFIRACEAIDAAQRKPSESSSERENSGK
jgi:ureidoacrylate peracid hydrolase